jgi:hypothetical protein
MTETPAPIEDREANIRHTVEMIVDSGHEAIYERLDKLHKRNIHDSDVMRALRALGFGDVADGYADWAEVDEREDDNTTTNPVVPDPGDSPSYDALKQAMAAGGGLNYTKGDVK